MIRATYGAAWVLTVAGLAPVCVRAQDISDEWQFGATIYGWLPDIAGKASFPSGGSSDINVDISTILDQLKMTGQGSFEIQKGRWGAFTDIVYLDVGDSKSRTRNIEIGGQPLPGTVEARVNFDLKSAIWTLAGNYRVLGGPEATFDLFAGTRLASFDQTLTWQFTGDFGPIAPPPLTGRRRSSVDQWDAIVGAKGQVKFGGEQDWVMPYYIDIGAGDSDMTWQAMVGIGYAFGWGEFGIAWRYMDYELKSGRPIRDMNFNGPAIGATFRW
jgi:hypothetical protein